MPATRVVLVDIPVLLRELVELSLRRRPDIQVEAVAPESTDALITASGAPDLMIFGLPDSELPPYASRMLHGVRGSTLLGLSAEGRVGSLYDLRPHRTPLGEFSESVLYRVLDSLRASR